MPGLGGEAVVPWTHPPLPGCCPVLIHAGVCFKSAGLVCWFDALVTILFERRKWGCSWSTAPLVGGFVNLHHRALLGCVLFLFDPARPLHVEGVLIRCDLL